MSWRKWERMQLLPPPSLRGGVGGYRLTDVCVVRLVGFDRVLELSWLPSRWMYGRYELATSAARRGCRSAWLVVRHQGKSRFLDVTDRLTSPPVITAPIYGSHHWPHSSALLRLRSWTAQHSSSSIAMTGCLHWSHIVLASLAIDKCKHSPLKVTPHSVVMLLWETRWHASFTGVGVSKSSRFSHAYCTWDNQQGFASQTPITGWTSQITTPVHLEYQALVEGCKLHNSRSCTNSVIILAILSNLIDLLKSLLKIQTQ